MIFRSCVANFTIYLSVYFTIYLGRIFQTKISQWCHFFVDEMGCSGLEEAVNVFVRWQLDENGKEAWDVKSQENPEGCTGEGKRWKGNVRESKTGIVLELILEVRKNLGMIKNHTRLISTFKFRYYGEELRYITRSNIFQAKIYRWGYSFIYEMGCSGLE